MKINLSTAAALANELVDSGIAMNAGPGASSGGRPAGRIELNPDFMAAIGMEFSPRGLVALLVDLAGRVVERLGPLQPDDWTRGCMLESLRECAGQMRSRAAGRRLAGVGIGVAGVVGPGAGVSRDFPHVTDWKDVDLAADLQPLLGLDVLVENDVRAATLAELRLGAGRGLRDFLYLHLGRGLALGMVFGGRLHEGACRAAGELGHFQVMQDGPVCYCGSTGCLESLAAPRALLAQAAEAVRQGVKTALAERAVRPEDLSAADLFAAAAAGDRLARNLVERAGETIGRITAGLDSVLDPQAIVLGGVLSDGAQVLADAIAASHRARVMPLIENSTEFRCAQLGQDAPAIGAAMVVFERVFGDPRRLLPAALAGERTAGS